MYHSIVPLGTPFRAIRKVYIFWFIEANYNIPTEAPANDIIEGAVGNDQYSTDYVMSAAGTAAGWSLVPPVGHGVGTPAYSWRILTSDGGWPQSAGWTVPVEAGEDDVRFFDSNDLHDLKPTSVDWKPLYNTPYVINPNGDFWFSVAPDRIPMRTNPPAHHIHAMPALIANFTVKAPYEGTWPAGEFLPTEGAGGTDWGQIYNTKAAAVADGLLHYWDFQTIGTAIEVFESIFYILAWKDTVSTLNGYNYVDPTVAPNAGNTHIATPIQTDTGLMSFYGFNGDGVGIKPLNDTYPAKDVLSTRINFTINGSPANVYDHATIFYAEGNADTKPLHIYIEKSQSMANAVDLKIDYDAGEFVESDISIAGGSVEICVIIHSEYNSYSDDYDFELYVSGTLQAYLSMSKHFDFRKTNVTLGIEPTEASGWGDDYVPFDGTNDEYSIWEGKIAELPTVGVLLQGTKPVLGISDAEGSDAISYADQQIELAKWQNHIANDLNFLDPYPDDINPIMFENTFEPELPPTDPTRGTYIKSYPVILLYNQTLSAEYSKDTTTNIALETDDINTLQDSEYNDMGGL